MRPIDKLRRLRMLESQGSMTRKETTHLWRLWILGRLWIVDKLPEIG